jgi:hypothetical protein
MEFEVNREIGATAERVWDLMTDLRGSADVVGSISRIEVLEGGDEFGVGTRWRETRTMFGREATEEMSVSAMAPGRSYTVVADSAGTHFESTLEVIPAGDHMCILRMTFSGEPRSVVSKVMSATVGRMFVGATRKAAEQDLADIAAAAEAGAGGSRAESGGRPAGP